MSPDLRAKTLFTVESAGPFIHSAHHARFRVCEELHFPRDDNASRFSTPTEDELSTPAPEVKTRTYLRFTVDNIGDQTSIVFGSERETCDVYVYSASKISRRIFAVELENHGRSAMLKNLSTRGIDIESPMYERIRFRRKRALHPDDKVTIFLPGFNIEVQFRGHSDHAAIHELYLQQLRPLFDLAVPGVNQLGLDSIPESSARPQEKTPYRLHHVIGSGEFGTVYRGMHSHTGALVAIKVFRKRHSDHSNEVAVLSSLLHPNIVRFIDYYSARGEPPMLVMELLDFQNLEEAHQREPFLVEETRDLMSELLSGLDYLHSEQVAHRDLKPTNIIIVRREPMSIKITDFGLARRPDPLRHSDVLKTHCGTDLYAAPEIYAGPYTNKADMWSVGVIALELGDGLPIYPKRLRDWPGLLRQRLETALIPPLFYVFVKSLLVSQAGHRPSARESRRHGFLQPESHFIDAVASPTVYAPTPPEYYQRSNGPGLSHNDDSQNELPDNEESAPEMRQAVPARVSAPVYSAMKYGGFTVMYRPDVGLVNVTQLLKALSHKRSMKWASLDAKVVGMHRSVVPGHKKCHGFYVGGSYVPLTDAERILRQLGLPTAAINVLSRQIGCQT